MIDRGMNPLVLDRNFMTTIHHVIELEKIEYLHYLLFGTYDKPKSLYTIEDFQKKKFII